MENTVTMHLATTVTLIAMAFGILGIPYLVGLLIDRLLKVETTRRDYGSTWFFGGMGLIIVGLFVSMIYVAYTGIFTYYTKP
jgi:hypothetical protein